MPAPLMHQPAPRGTRGLMKACDGSDAAGGTGTRERRPPRCRPLRRTRDAASPGHRPGLIPGVTGAVFGEGAIRSSMERVEPENDSNFATFAGTTIRTGGFN